MDFLILFSSVGRTYGYYGQSNYASANTFLNSFSQYRQGLGLAASVISMGPIDDIGLVARTASTRDALLNNLASLLTETYVLETVQLAIAHSSTSYALEPKSVESPFSGFQAPNHIFHSTESATPIQDPENRIIWKRDPRMLI
ncbi:KR-domain-containing protein [Lepidopterella palustris CBS 459.81]|uniref:KR-domain-containing protein n=1 Tax=Lepidopterella palustris CBS 459.81 TaxID=1314670 RepID=A0A8E2E706_9PEZI|nr:KR-domain-containing protein [Lepidopterella palustris CBS 459.81]